MNTLPDVELSTIRAWLETTLSARPLTIGPRAGMGKHTAALLAVRAGEQEYVFKYYNIVHGGQDRETENYMKFRDQGPIASPVWVYQPDGWNSSRGLLLPEYDIFRAGCLTEVVAAQLVAASAFCLFEGCGRIYFDLAEDCLRRDNTGGLRLIDLTDLVAPAELPLLDRFPASDDRLIPPEGKRYSLLHRKYVHGPQYAILRRATAKLCPNRYQSYTAAMIGLSLMGVGSVREVPRRATPPQNPEWDEYKPWERKELTELLRRALRVDVRIRITTQDLCAGLWAMLMPRLAVGSADHLLSRNLLRTIAPDPNGLGAQVRSLLEPFWNGAST